MTTTELTNYDFIITVDGDIQEMFQGGDPVEINIRNPHPVGEFDQHTLSYIRAVIKKIGMAVQVQKENVEMKTQLEQLKVDLAEARRDRDFTVKQGLLTKKAILELLK